MQLIYDVNKIHNVDSGNTEIQCHLMFLSQHLNVDIFERKKETMTYN